MRLLILGGTVFLGPALVAAAGRRGHQVTLFNRGQSAPPSALPGVECLHGDRDGDLASLRGREWDAVIDTSGFVPRVVGDSARMLAAASGHYTFVSSISAFGDFSRRGLTEEMPVSELPEPESEDVERYYGELKAACEREVAAAFAGRSLIVRPGLIVGPQDPTERFTYWVRRLAAGGRVLAPRAHEQAVQLIDVRDLGDWIIDMSERRATGTFSATGPAARLMFIGMLERMQAAIGRDAELCWIKEESLAGAGVEPWDELPLWLDLPRHPDLHGFLEVDVTRAASSGLRLRELEQTTIDTLAWAEQNPVAELKRFGKPIPLPGLGRDRELELLAHLARHDHRSS